MFFLDCSTRARALSTLSAGFDCHEADLERVLLSLDLEHVYVSDHSIMVDPCQYLREYVCRQLGTPGHFTSAYWFHGTRTRAGNSFPDGLLALNQSESRVMEMLISLAPDSTVKEKLQAWNFHGSVPDQMFQMRTQEQMHWGPYGHLVRETHFHAKKLGQHDYARLPELVEDVCNAYREEYGYDLTAHYLRVLHPCIIWFISDIEDETGALEAALRYAYTSVRALSPNGGSVYGIDREGKSVTLDAITRVEFIEVQQI